MSDRQVRFSGDCWQEIEALPKRVGWAVQRVIFHLLEEPVPTLADPFPEDDQGQEIISIQLVRLVPDAFCGAAA